MRKTMFQFANCLSCEVAIGEYHRPGCVGELCPYCGRNLVFCMRLGCRCKSAPFWPPPLDDRIPWNGTPIAAEKCYELDWFVRPVAGELVQCRGDEEGARPDIERLYREAIWDRRKGRFVVPRKAKSRKPQPSQIMMLPMVESQGSQTNVIVVPPQKSEPGQATSCDHHVA